jgi:hypothetical protein
MELHQRISFGFVPLIFCILGVSLTLLPRPSRANRSWGLMLCIFWLMAYYALLSFGKALGDKRKYRYGFHGFLKAPQFPPDGWPKPCAHERATNHCPWPDNPDSRSCLWAAFSTDTWPPVFSAFFLSAWQ